MSSTKVEPNHLDVTSFVQAGVLIPYAGTTAPTGFLLCDGSAVSRTTYATLFGIISTTWGVGDGSTTFNLPDCRGRTGFGKSTAGTLSTFASNGGSETHSHTTVAHTHSVNSHNHSGPTHNHTTTGDGAHTHTGNGAAASAGGPQNGGTFITDNPGNHTHTIQNAGISTSGPDLSATSASASPSTASGSNVNPYIVLNYLIKV